MLPQPPQSRPYNPQPILHPQGIDPRTGKAVVGSGGGIPYSKKMHKQHMDSLQSAYTASIPKRHFHDQSAQVYHANTAASTNASAASIKPPVPPITFRPDGKIIWNTAPFFNKHNLTPRVNAFFGIGDGRVKRDAYIQRMITERDRDVEDPVRDRALPTSGVELQLSEDAEGNINVCYFVAGEEGKVKKTENFQEEEEEEEEEEADHVIEVEVLEEEMVGEEVVGGEEGEAGVGVAEEIEIGESDTDTEDDEEYSSSPNRTYAEMHEDKRKKKQIQIEQIISNGGSYGLKYMWRQAQIQR